MKLILSSDSSKKFVDFYDELQGDQKVYDYCDYISLLFYFDTAATSYFINLKSGRKDSEYDGAYIRTYHDSFDLAVTAAAVFDNHEVAYVDRELSGAPSLSKLSEYAKLAHANVRIPKSFGGSAHALLSGIEAGIIDLELPIILKRADADRGADNYKLSSYDEVRNKLADRDQSSVWILQQHIPNNGFYRVGVYGNQAQFTIFRSLDARPDGREDLAHMYKPHGGKNATLIEVSDVPPVVIEISCRASEVMNRQFAGVDCIYDVSLDRAYVLEVNNSPQLVTIKTFQDVRKKAFLDAINSLGR